MNDLLNKIKMVLEKGRRKDFSYDKPTIRPVKDWVKILVLTHILIFFSAIFALYFYMQVDSGQIFNVINEVQENEVKIKSELLQKTKDYIDEREKMFNEIKLESIPTDPAI